MSPLLALLKAEAVRRGLYPPTTELDAQAVFALVRDIPYRRASNRQPETIIAEWQGTCSGKHYLLHDLFAELGLASSIMACTVSVPVAEENVPEAVRPLWEASNRRFVDIHNYLVVHHPVGDTIVDATWPLNTPGQVSSAGFIPGQDQPTALKPEQSWPIPPGRDPQDFKNELLHRYFTDGELAFRELLIAYMSKT